jgi:Arc/MetJ-type ribon-helix-helix transcriptional regulator
MATVTRVFTTLPSTVDRLERDAISRSFDKGQQAGDEELAEFIKYHRQHWQEKEQAAKDWQAEHDRFMREEAAKARKKLRSHDKESVNQKPNLRRTESVKHW